MSQVIDKQTRDLILRLNKQDDDIKKLKADIIKLTDRSVTIIKTGSTGSLGALQTNSVNIASDPTAIRVNNSYELFELDEKTAIVDEDLLMIEDSEAFYDKKKVQITNIVDSLLAEIIALGIPFNEIINPTADVDFTFGNKHLHITFVNPDTEGGFILEGLGNFQGKSIVHLHQHTGNVTAEAWLRTVEWIDAQIVPERWSNDAGTTWLKFALAALSTDRLITYPDKDLTFAVDTAAEAIAAVEGEATLDLLGELSLDDSKKIFLGTDNDIQIYHNGSNAWFKNLTGDVFFLIDNSFTIRDDADSDVKLFVFGTNTRTLVIGQAADLIATTFNGNIAVTGSITNPASNKGYATGTTGQFSMKHNGTNAFLLETSGSLFIGVTGANQDIFFDIRRNFQLRDLNDGSVTLLKLDSSGRTLAIGAAADPINITHHGNFLMGGTGSDDEALQLPYLTQAPATLVNGKMWMESNGVHVYYNGSERLLVDTAS